VKTTKTYAMAATLAVLTCFALSAPPPPPAPQPVRTALQDLGEKIFNDTNLSESRGTPFVLALAGFIVGIESAQIAVALMAGLVVLVLSRIKGPAIRQRAARHSAFVGLVLGSFWFIERIAHGA